MTDGAFQGIGAERALRTILGGEPAPTSEETEAIDAMRARILAAPIEATTYDGACLATARLILDAWAAYPNLREVPFEATYLQTPTGAHVVIDDRLVELRPGLHTVLKAVYHHRPEALAVLTELTGFMWGWACNAAQRVSGGAPVANPALLTVETR